MVWREINTRPYQVVANRAQERLFGEHEMLSSSYHIITSSHVVMSKRAHSQSVPRSSMVLEAAASTPEHGLNGGTGRK